MKKFMSILLSSVLFATVLAGCGGSSQPTPAPAEPAAPAAEAPAAAAPAAEAPAAAPAAAGPTVTYKLGHMSPLDNNYNLMAEKFKALVAEKSGGRINIEIYPQAQLGYDRDLLEAMQFGTVDFAVNTTAPISNFAPMYGVLDLPYLFSGWDHIEKFVQSDAALEMLATSEAEGLVGLGIMPRGFRSLTNNKKPVYTLDDIKGLKVRVVESPAYVKTFEDFGAVVSAMSWGEVFTALQQGAIDGQENPPETIRAERVYEVQDYLSLTQHIAGFACIMGSKMVFDGMSPEDQAIIREAAMEAALAEGKNNRANEEAIKKQLNDELGLAVNEVELDQFKAVATSAYDWFEGIHGSDMVDKIKALDK